MPSTPLFTGNHIRLGAFRPEDAETAARWTEDAEFQRQLDTDFARPATAQEQAEMLNSRRSPNSVNFALRTLDSERSAIADAAARHGFNDQAHATHDLVRWTGITPARLVRALRADPDGGDALRLAAAFVRGHHSTP